MRFSPGKVVSLWFDGQCRGEIGNKWVPTHEVSHFVLEDGSEDASCMLKLVLEILQFVQSISFSMRSVIRQLKRYRGGQHGLSPIA